MRKLLVVLAVAGIMLACNNNDSNVEEPDDDSTRLPNTLSPADTSTIPVDTSRRVADTTLKK